MDPPFISPATLPSAATIEFKASSFFSRHPALPSPADVRAFASSPEGIAQRAAHCRMHFTIMFPHLGLLVKWGRHITIAEGQCMWACRHLLSGIIPVPEIYGWVTDKDHGDTEVFIYMEVIKGVMLENRWPVMSISNKTVSFEKWLYSVRRLEGVVDEGYHPDMLYLNYFYGRRMGTRMPIRVGLIIWTAGLFSASIGVNTCRWVGGQKSTFVPAGTTMGAAWTTRTIAR